MEQRAYVHQIHPVLPVWEVVGALDYFESLLGFRIAFADDSKNPKYMGILKDALAIRLPWKDATKWDREIGTPTLGIVAQNIEELYSESSENTILK